MGFSQFKDKSKKNKQPVQGQQEPVFVRVKIPRNKEV